MTLSPPFSQFESLVILSGVSGGGRSTALHCFADFGYYAVDNLPIGVFAPFVELSRKSPAKFARTALTLDTDFYTAARELVSLLDYIKDHEKIRILFFDCDNSAVLKRYSETRRPHPGFNGAIDSTLQDTIHRERELLDPIRNRAHFVLDTTDLTVHDLRREVLDFVNSLSLIPHGTKRLNFISFGFKYGQPRDCDLVIDVRFLPNPHFVDSLKDKTGLEKDVSDYVFNSEDSREFLSRYKSLLEFLLPRYAHEGKSYLNIGIGCTGGKHRSVAIAESLAKQVGSEGFTIGVKHRDISRA